MNEQKFNEAKGLLAHSQQMRDSFMQSQMPQTEMAQPQQDMVQPPQDMSQPPQAPQVPQEAPEQTQLQETSQPTKGVGGLEKAGAAIVSAFHEITSVFKQTEKKQEAQVKSIEEKHDQEMKEIKDGLRKIIED